MSDIIDLSQLASKKYGYILPQNEVKNLVIKHHRNSANQNLVDFAGAGATVPLTGFGHTIATGVKEAVNEDGFLGIFLGGLKASAGGITAAILFGLLMSIIFKAKDKA